MKKIILFTVLLCLINNVVGQTNTTVIISSTLDILAEDSEISVCEWGDFACPINNAITGIKNILKPITDLYDDVTNLPTILTDWYNDHAATGDYRGLKILWLPFDISLYFLRWIELWINNPWEGIKALFGAILLIITLIGMPFLLFFVLYHGLIFCYVIYTEMRKPEGLTIYTVVMGMFNSYFYIINLVWGRVAWPFFKKLWPFGSG